MEELMSNDELKIKLKNNYGIEVFSTELLKEISLLNWRVIFELKNAIYLTSSLFKTNKERGWIEEFYIYTIPVYANIIFLVSSNCPEYLFVDPSDLIDPIKKYLEKTNINFFNRLNYNTSGISISNDLRSYISSTSSSMLLTNFQTSN